MTEAHDVAIIGGGILGLATARALLVRGVARSPVVLEKEERVAAHQTGHNSGVIHSGLYYKPGSLKATTCANGREALVRFCEEHAIRYDRCGKVVVATRPEEVPRLDELERRGRANGLEGLTRLSPEALREIEPHVAGVDALLVKETGIVDYVEVTRAIAADVEARGGHVRTGARVTAVLRGETEHVIETTRGEFAAKMVVNCAGLACDRVARMCGLKPEVRIVPFRGEYYELVPERAHLVRNLVYPVPDPEFPFLGIHFTRRITGGIQAGPNAVLALKREGYTKTSLNVADTWSTVTFAGFWRMAGKYWKTGVGEMWRSWNKAAFTQALRALVPEIEASDLGPGGAGVRAQALDAKGALVDDFCIAKGERMVHVLNAPSPGATASLAIGEHIAGVVATG